MFDKKNIRYKGIVKDPYYPDNSHDDEHGGFKTPEDALKWANETARKTGFTHVRYWVEYDCSMEVDGYFGST